MQKYNVFFFLMIFFFSCGPSAEEKAIKRLNLEVYEGRVLRDNTEEITYYRDKRTNICFAQCQSGANSMLTCVPCDSAVLAIIKQQLDIDIAIKNYKIKLSEKRYD